MTIIVHCPECREPFKSDTTHTCAEPYDPMIERVLASFHQARLEYTRRLDDLCPEGDGQGGPRNSIVRRFSHTGTTRAGSHHPTSYDRFR